MSQYTCITCRVAFHDVEIQRQHYKTDWHRYNLKRKVVDFPPVTSEDFQNRVISQRQQDEEKARDKSVYCQACRKNFSTQNAHDNHLNSKKHKDNLNAVSNMIQSDIPTEDDKPQKSNVADIITNSPEEDDMEVEEVDSDEWNEDTENPINNNNCLFCNHHSSSLFRNLNHMTISHSFFLPEAEYCIDVRGLLLYLGEKITQGFMCIWCNEKGKTFHSADSVQKHMVDKGHCKMLHEGVALAEYADYYDYSASYPDQAEEDVDDDSEVNVPVIDGSDHQLVLPSGIVVGHRSLMRYYKQSIDKNKTVVTVAENKKLHKVLAQYRALGWTASQQQAIAKKARDLHYMKRVQAKSNMRMGVKANKFQTHYRPQVLF